MNFNIAMNMKKLKTTVLVVFILISVKTSNAQNAQGYISIEEPPPIMLEKGNMVDLFAAFREKPGSLVFQLESNEQVVPVSFQTIVKRNGEPIGKSTRKPMPYFPGEMVMCPESFDFISLLYHEADEKGILPKGKYQVGIIVLDKKGRALGKESRFEFSAP